MIKRYASRASDLWSVALHPVSLCAQICKGLFGWWILFFDVNSTDDLEGERESASVWGVPQGSDQCLGTVHGHKHTHQLEVNWKLCCKWHLCTTRSNLHRHIYLLCLYCGQHFFWHSFEELRQPQINGKWEQAPFFCKLEEVANMPPKSLLKFGPSVTNIFKIFSATIATHQCDKGPETSSFLALGNHFLRTTLSLSLWAQESLCLGKPYCSSTKYNHSDSEQTVKQNRYIHHSRQFAGFFPPCWHCS